MKEEDFFETVKLMRLAQMRYFRTREKNDLMMSKSLEKHVDALLVKWQERKHLSELNRN